MAAENNHILGIDIGTTAVKVALKRSTHGHAVEAEIGQFDGAQQNSHAYTTTDDPAIKEQSVQYILQTIGTCLMLISGRPSTKSIRCTGVGIDGQMHGICLWSSKDPIGTVSNLATWEDQRGAADGSVASWNSALWSSGHRRAPLFPGYGVVTILRHLHALPQPIGRPSTGTDSGSDTGAPVYDRVGTIACYVACAVTGCWEPALEATEAAAWGCFDVAAGQWDMEAAASLHPALPSLLPRIVPTGSVVGTAGSPGCHPMFSTANLPSFLRGVPVTVALGDHPASVVQALLDSRAAEGSSNTSPVAQTTVMVNVGTSAQLALLGPPVEVLACRAGQGQDMALPPGCELRPFPRLPSDSTNATATPAPCMLVGASMNGGSALAAVAAAVRSAALGQGASTGAGTGQVYGWLEREGMRYMTSLTEAMSSSSAPSPCLPLSISSLPIPERVPQGWGQDGQNNGQGKGREDETTGVPSMSLTVALASLSPSSSSSPAAQLKPGLVYAATARAVAARLVGTLPSHIVRDIVQDIVDDAKGSPTGQPARVRVHTSGGALSKSRVLRLALALELATTAGAGMEALGPLERVLGGQAADSGPESSPSASPRSPVPAGQAGQAGPGPSTTEYAGALGTALVTEAWLRHNTAGST